MVREYDVLPKQRQFLELPHKWRAFLGGWGCGKTTAGCMEVIRCAVQYPGSRGLVARKTWRELMHTTMDVLFSLMPWELVLRHDKEDGVLYVLSGGDEPSVIFYRPLDRREKIEGLNLSYFYVDEAAEIGQEMFEALQGRVRSPIGPRRGWITSTPPSVGHWIYKKFIQSKHPDYGVVFASSYDNKYLPKDYLEYLETSLSGETYKRMVLGQFGVEVAGSPIFINFSDAIHVISEDEAMGIVSRVRAVYRGIDFGYWHPAAVWGVLDEWSRLVIVEEFIGEQMTLDAFLEKLKEVDALKFHSVGAKVVSDFHDPHSVYRTDVVFIDRAEVMRNRGFNPVPSSIGDSVIYGIDLISRALDSLVMGVPLIRVSSGCTMLVEGFRGGYCWDAKGKVPEGNIFVHLFDALRYLYMGLKGRIANVSYGSDISVSPRGLTYTEDYKLK